ncbi:MAG TPA: hypothetical protein VIF39_02865 [Hyphomicrobium sp.]|jgi:hypothetical protein
MAKRAKTKVPNYSGKLAKPIPIWSLQLDPEFPPLVNPALHLEGLELDVAELATRWRHFVLEGRSAYWREVADCTKLLLKHHGLDPTLPVADDALLHALMTTHVPAFNIKLARDQYLKGQADKPTKLDVADTCMLLVRQIILDLRDKRALDKLETKWLKKINGHLLGVVRQRTIDAYAQQMRRAFAAYLRGDPTDFQRQYIERALPEFISSTKQIPARLAALKS